MLHLDTHRLELCPYVSKFLFLCFGSRATTGSPKEILTRCVRAVL